MAADLETQLRHALRDSRYDETVDVDDLLRGIAGPAASRADELRSTTVARRFLPAVSGAALVAATVAIVVSISVAGSPSADRHGSAAQPASCGVATSTRPSALPTSTTTRVFPWTPYWLPYGLDLRTSVVAGDSMDLWVSQTRTGVGPSVSIQAADAKTLHTLDRWDHFKTSPLTVCGRPANLALATGNRAGDRYLLFQPTQGQWLLVIARRDKGMPADVATMIAIANGLVRAPLPVPAPGPSSSSQPAR